MKSTKKTVEAPKTAEAKAPAAKAPEAAKAAEAPEKVMLGEWYDRNLGALDCEQSAWDLMQTVTQIAAANSDCKYAHVYSDGEAMYATTGAVLVKMTAPYYARRCL